MWDWITWALVAALSIAGAVVAFRVTRKPHDADDDHMSIW